MVAVEVTRASHRDPLNVCAPSLYTPSHAQGISPAQHRPHSTVVFNLTIDNFLSKEKELHRTNQSTSQPAF